MQRLKSSWSNGDSNQSSNLSDFELQKVSDMKPTSSSSSTIYEHLRESDEIRLLYLQPRSSEQDTAIRCTMQQVKLSEAPIYEALSYMWGPKGNSKSIYVDANTCYVRENLWLALYQLRLKNEVRVLWIDAICINQDDVVERSYQVSQMGRIYSNASRAVVWLGDTDSDSSLAIKVLSQTGQDSDWASFSEKSILFAPATEKGILKLNAIRSICYREYWTRLWIIQEILSAADILLCCGEESLPWSSLSSFFTRLTRPFSFSESTGLTRDSELLVIAIDDSIPARLFREATKRRYMETWNKSNDRSLFGFCVEYGEAKCEDRRDKIFGLHAFARDCCRKATPIDYSLSWHEIYSMVLIHFILQHTDRKLFGDDVLYVLQEFHQKLGFTSNEIVWSIASRSRLDKLALNYMNLELGPFPLKFHGNVRGRVKLSVPLQVPDTELPSGAKLPPFLQVYISQLHFIENLHPYQPEQKHRVSKQIDLVWPANQGSSRVSCPVKPSFPNYIGRTDPGTGSTQKFLLQKDDTTAVGDSIKEILHDAQEAVRGSHCTDLTLAFEENGLICFCPREVRVGDLICQFLSSDILAVVRPGWRGYTLVGRAVSFLASEPKTPFQALPIRRHMTKDFDVRLCRVLFEMDVLGVQMMARASVNPAPQGAHSSSYETRSQCL